MVFLLIFFFYDIFKVGDSMFEKIKNLMLIEIRQELVALKEKKEKLSEDLNAKNAERASMSDVRVNIINKVLEFSKNYPWLTKIIHRKKYENDLNAFRESINKEISMRRKAINDLIGEIYEEEHKNEKEISSVLELLDNVEKAENIEQLQISYDEVKALLSRNDINIFDYSCDEILKLGSSAETTGNLQFMKKAINDYPFNILYDQTNDFDMYYEFINGLECDITSTDEAYRQEKEYFDVYKKSILKFLEDSKNGLIHIKPIHILEVIRFYFKDVIMYENGELGKGSNKEIRNALHHINVVIKNALSLSIEDYDQLFSMYNPSDNNYYCHRTGVMGVEDSILKKGLEVSSQGTYGATKAIVRNARKIDCFLAIAGYHNFYAGNGVGESRIILEIPKDCERPIGSNTMDGKKTYVLPEYVIASLYEKPIYDENGNRIGNEKPVLHINNQKKNVYRYLYCDGYDPNQPLPIENPDYEDVNKQNRNIKK